MLLRFAVTFAKDFVAAASLDAGVVNFYGRILHRTLQLLESDYGSYWPVHVLCNRRRRRYWQLTAFEALEPGNNIGVNDVLRRPTVSYCFKVKPENGSTVVIVCLFPVWSLLHKGK